MTLEPLPPNRPIEARPAPIQSFTRLARTQVLLMAGEALMALALAGSLFFSIEPDAARQRIALYLALTMAPFTLVSPLIGPLIDRARGGRRTMVVLTAGVRSLLCLAMIPVLDDWQLFPLAFGALVASKGYYVARSALVPTLVKNRRLLITANSRLAVLAGLGAAVAIVPGGIALRFGGSESVMALAALTFTWGAAVAWRIPTTPVASEPADADERSELRSAGIISAASAMGLLRGIVGFFAFLMAFHLRSIDAATAWFGVLLALSSLGNMTGALAVPHIRQRRSEETILVGALILVGTMAVAVVVLNGLWAACLLAAAVGVSAGGGKMAFDAIVQRDAPDANQGRSFARFETRFQLVWVVGAFIPTVLPFDVLSVRLGYIVIALVSGFAAFTYVAALRAIARGEQPEPAVRIPARVQPGLQDLQHKVRDRLPNRRVGS